MESASFIGECRRSWLQGELHITSTQEPHWRVEMGQKPARKFGSHASNWRYGYPVQWAHQITSQNTRLDPGEQFFAMGIIRLETITDSSFKSCSVAILVVRNSKTTKVRDLLLWLIIRFIRSLFVVEAWMLVKNNPGLQLEAGIV